MNKTETPHISEYELQQFILHSPLLNHKELKRIQLHLESCSFCREQYYALLTLYAKQKSIDADDVSKEAIDLFERLSNTSAQKDVLIIQLFPMQKKTKIMQDKPNLLALAAQGTTTQLRYTPLATLTTHDEKTFVRIVQDNKKKKSIVQILSDEKRDYDCVLLSIANLPAEYITDHDGEVILSDFPKEIDASNMNAFIRLPYFEFMIDDDAFNKLITDYRVEIVDSKVCEISITLIKETNAFHIKITSIHPSISFRKILLIHEDNRTLFELHDNCATIENTFIKKGTVIKLFQ